MATFLMIHGAWHGGGCFDKLRSPLEALGHVMVAPTLPGMDGDARAIAAVTLDDWAAFVVEQARALPGPVILCAHSRGGIVASMATERDPQAFSALVYLAAFMLPSGVTMIEARNAMPRNDAFETGLSVAARGAALAISAEAAEVVFYQDCAPEDRAAAASRLAPEPVAPLNTPLALTDARFGSVPRHYIACTLDQAIPFVQQQMMLDRLPCESVTMLESGHSPFLSMPGKLADVLHTITERI
jgi:pimeloyl-ACP methyl ester carboxylesterase